MSKVNIKNQSEKDRYFKTIADKLRNMGIPHTEYMKYMWMFVAYKVLDKHIESLGFEEECCKWSFLLEQGLDDVISTFREGVREFKKDQRTANIFFIPEKIVDHQKMQDFIREIEKIPDDALEHTDIMGDIYEYLAVKDNWHGSYYTPRNVCRLSMKLIQKTIGSFLDEDGYIYNFGDFFCGSGGFGMTYCQFINETEKVDWKRNIDRIYCSDNDSNSVANSMLNIMLVTGTASDSKHIRHTDSFCENMFTGVRAHFPNLKLKIGLSNPPYGGTFKADNVNEDIERWKNKINLSTGSAVQLMLSSLDKDAIQGIVLDNGFYGNSGPKSLVELRKMLAKDYKIHYIVDIEKGAFTNTSIATKLIIFSNREKAGDVIPCYRTIENENGELEIESIGEIYVDKMSKKNWSLDLRSYDEIIVTSNDGYEVKTLGELIVYEKKPGKLKAGDGKSEGKYRFYTCAKEIKYVDVCEFKKECIILNRGGRANVRYDDEFSIDRDDMFVITSNDKINQKYLYYYLKGNISILENEFAGLTIKKINKQKLANIQVIVPPLEKQLQIVEILDKLFSNYDDMITAEEIYCEKTQEVMRDHVKLMLIINQVKRLGDVAELKAGKAITKKEFVEGPYKVIGGGVSEVGYHNEYNLESGGITIAKIGTCGHCARHKENVYVTSNCFILKNKTENIINDYLYYLTKLSYDNLQKVRRQTAQPYLNDVDIYNNVLVPIISQEAQQFCIDEIDDYEFHLENINKIKAKYSISLKQILPSINVEYTNSTKTEEREIKPKTTSTKPKSSETKSKSTTSETDYSIFSKSNEEIKKKYKGKDLNEIMKTLQIERDDIVNKNRLEPKIEHIRKHLIEKGLIKMEKCEVPGDIEEKTETVVKKEEIKEVEKKSGEAKSSVDYSIFDKTNEEIKKKMKGDRLKEIMRDLGINDEKILNGRLLDPKIELIRKKLKEESEKNDKE